MGVRCGFSHFTWEIGNSTLSPNFEVVPLKVTKHCRFNIDFHEHSYRRPKTAYSGASNAAVF